MVQYGRRIFGLMRPISEAQVLAFETTKPKEVYQINMEVDKAFDAEYLASVLVERFEAAFPDLRINWIDVCPIKKTVKFQFVDTSGVVGFAAILALLPQILLLAGVAIVLLSIWNIISAVPTWAWALLAVGVIFLIFGPGIAKALTPPRYATAPPPLVYRYAY